MERRSLKKQIRASTGFEPVTSAITVRCSTNWAMKPHVYRGGHRVSVWIMVSCQESRNPSSLGNCCFSSGEEFSSTENKEIENGDPMPLSSKQNKNVKLWDVPEVTSFVTNLSIHGQLHWAWPKREIQSLMLRQKVSEFTFLDDIQNLKKPFGCMDTLSTEYRMEILKQCSSNLVLALFITKKPNDTHIVVAMETLLVPVSFFQKPNILIFNPLKWQWGFCLKQT